MERWQNNKRQDFRQLLMGMADKNIQYYEKVCGIVVALAGIKVVHCPPGWWLFFRKCLYVNGLRAGLAWFCD